MVTLDLHNNRLRFFPSSPQEERVLRKLGLRQSGNGWIVPSPACWETVDPVAAALGREHVRVSQRARAFLDAEERRREAAAKYHTGEVTSEISPRTSATLSPYQAVGAKYLLWARAAILADEPGLGKTAQAIVAADYTEADTRLVIAPKSLLHQWRLEIARFSGRPDAAVITTKGDIPRATWLVTNYEVAVARTAEFEALRPGVIIVDEAQRIKNRKARRTQAVFRLSRVSQYRFLLTGTPVDDRPKDIWPLLHVVDWNRYPSFWDFAGLFVEQEFNGFGIELGGWRQDRLPLLRKELMPRLLARRKALLNLPSLTEEVVHLSLDSKAEKSYEQMEQELVVVLLSGEALWAPTALAKLTRLRQIATDPALIGAPGSSCKTEWILDWAEDNVPAHRAIVFSPFAAYVERLTETLQEKGIKAAALTGSLSVSRRAELCEMFRRGDLHVIVAVDSVGGEGLNLQTADTVIFANKSWTPESVEQCIARAHRRGQENPVHVYHLVASGTVDEVIESTVASKAKEIELIKVLDHEARSFLRSRGYEVPEDAEVLSRA